MRIGGGGATVAPSDGDTCPPPNDRFRQEFNTEAMRKRVGGGVGMYPQKKYDKRKKEEE